MIRKIIHIDEEKCNGCGLCAEACHEGAIEMVNGKARLMRDDYCDGLGDCLPACPTGAITFTEREAAAYDEEAVKRHLAKRDGAPSASGAAASQPGLAPQPSQLCQWPVQIKLAPVRAPFQRRPAPHRRRLHRLRLRQLPPGFHPWPCDADRLSQAGRRGLHGEADRDPLRK